MDSILFEKPAFTQVAALTLRKVYRVAVCLSAQRCAELYYAVSIMLIALMCVHPLKDEVILLKILLV